MLKGLWSLYFALILAVAVGIAFSVLLLFLLPILFKASLKMWFLVSMVR